MLRALGSPEALLEKVGVAAQRFSVVATLEPVEVRAGHAVIRAFANPGFERHELHCQWTTGMLSQATALFGLPPAHVAHEACQAHGAPDCRYTLIWDSRAAPKRRSRQRSRSSSASSRR